MASEAMIGRGTRAHVLSLIGACVVALGCDSGLPSKYEPRTELESNPSNEKHTLCGSSVSIDGWAQVETYSFPLMNDKLLRYPAFARAIGMTSVSTCDDARMYMDAYNRYIAKHASFDEDSPPKAELDRQWIEEASRGRYAPPP